MEVNTVYYKSSTTPLPRPSTTPVPNPELDKYIPSFSLFDKGWVCPKCGMVNAPWVAQCPCLGKKANSYTTIK